MGISSFIPHILYENNDQLYIAYSHEIDVTGIYNEVNGLTVQEHIANMYLKCRSFEDFPLAFTEFMKTISMQLILAQHHRDHHRNLIFTSVAELTGQKYVLDKIDLRKDFLKLWSTQFITFMNLTDYIITITCNDGEPKFLPPNEAIQLSDGCQPFTMLYNNRKISPIMRLVASKNKQSVI